MGWIVDQIVDGIKSIFDMIADAFLGFAQAIFEALLRPIVGVPTPKSDSGYIVWFQPSNEPWASIYTDVYLAYILPLTIGLLIVATAYIGLRMGSVSNYKRKHLLRRITIVFFGAFFWFPTASAALQFVNAIGMTLAPINAMSNSFAGLAKAGLGGVFVILLMAVVENVLLIAAALLYAVRWLTILVLTPLIPFLGALWTFDVWPLSPMANLARKAAGVYPGLVLAGLPAAVLLRIGWQLNFTDSLFDLFLALVMIPAACLVSYMTIKWSVPAMHVIARGGATANPQKNVKQAKQTTGQAVRGARNVHRGYSASGAVKKDGSKEFGAGDSTAYTIGSNTKRHADSAKSHAGKYNNLRNSARGRMRDKAKEDLKRVGYGAKPQAKRAFKQTKAKVSRW